MNPDLRFVVHKLFFVRYVNEIYGNFSQSGRKLFSQVIWPGAPWCSAATGHTVGLLTCKLTTSDLRKWGQHYYMVLFSPLSPFHWPQNIWPWITLNDLNGHFTLNFHYYELLLSNYLLRIYCRVRLHMWPAEKCGKRSSGLWSAEYLEPPEKLRIFHDTSSSEP